MPTHAEVNIRFEESSYTTSENILMMELCAIVDDPFERSILIRISTSPGTAQGETITCQCEYMTSSFLFFLKAT